MEQHFRQAVENIATLGDTDVFPLPIENLVLYDEPDKVVALLVDLHKETKDALDRESPINESSVAMVGYTAFRGVTQIDPIWNAYLLGLVLALAEEIEKSRIPVAEEVIFSYRYSPDPSSKRFFSDGAWGKFNQCSVQLAEEHSHVTVCDISDFYARIYHHRLENALTGLNTGTDLPDRINRILFRFAGETSYGLPVGGPAARILSELLLNRVDHLLLAKGIKFCRFADDYHLFSDSQEEAYRALLFLTEKLLQNEGLTLQKAKTRILTSKDFISSAEFGTPAPDPAESPLEVPEERTFLSLSLRYDPYSPTAEEDYHELSEQIQRYDITGMLARELSKSRLHAALTRRLLGALRWLDPAATDGAARALVDNLERLAPVYQHVMRALTTLFPKLGETTKAHLITAVRESIIAENYFVMVPVNLAYSVRLLALAKDSENEQLFARLFETAPPFVQRDIVLAMGRWRAQWWLSDLRNRYYLMHPWVRRAFVVSSFALGDEGRHWRAHALKSQTPFDRLSRDWAADRTKQSGWEIPL